MLLMVKDWNVAIKAYVGCIGDWMIGCTDNLTKWMSVGEGKKLVEVEYIGSKSGKKEKDKEKEKEK